MTDIDIAELLDSDSTAETEDMDEVSQDQQTLRHLRDELLRYRPDIPDQHSELRAAISEWLNVAFETRSGDLGEIVTREIHDLRTVDRDRPTADGVDGHPETEADTDTDTDMDMDTEPTASVPGSDGPTDADGSESDAAPAFSTYPMYNKRTVDDPANAFPDDCKGCPHYGTACPIVTDPTQKRALETITDDTNDADAVTDLHRLAMDNQCHVLKGILDSYESDLEPMLHAGVNLLMAAQDCISFNSTEEEIRQYVDRARSSATLSSAGAD